MYSFAHRLDRLTDGDFTKSKDFIRLMLVLYTCTLCVATEKSPIARQILPIIQKLEKHCCKWRHGICIRLEEKGLGKPIHPVQDND